MMLSAAHSLPDPDEPADLDNWELLIAAILAEASPLRAADRAELAARVIALGGYESPEQSTACNERARLALRLAARLTNAGQA